MKKILLACIISCMVFVGCNTSKEKNTEATNVVVFSLADADDKKEFGALKLDDTHSNLLNRDISKDEFEVVWKSWTEIHTALNQHLIKENFDWGVKDERIRLFNKIYFKKDGRVKYYVYGIRNNVTQEKIDAFGEIAKEFFGNQKISITKEADFAQCGKAALINSNIQKI